MAVTTKGMDEDGGRTGEERVIGVAEEVVWDNGDIGEWSGRSSRINAEGAEGVEGVKGSAAGSWSGKAVG